MAVLAYTPGFVIGDRYDMRIEREDNHRQNAVEFYMRTRLDMQPYTTNPTGNTLDATNYPMAVNVLTKSIILANKIREGPNGPSQSSFKRKGY